jgi:hypothetical protein
MKPLYLKPEQNKTPKEQWDELTEEEKWDEYLTALVTINEITEENETRGSSHINN